MPGVKTDLRFSFTLSFSEKRIMIYHIVEKNNSKRHADGLACRLPSLMYKVFVREENHV